MTDTDNHYLAQAVHDLGSALWFGGTVMGVAGVNKSGADLTQGIDRVRVAIRIRHYSPRTEAAYVSWIRRFIFHFELRHPASMGSAEVRDFLSHLAWVEHVSFPGGQEANRIIEEARKTAEQLRKDLQGKAEEESQAIVAR